MGKKPERKMSMEDRAKQFMSFSAIGPLGDALKKKEEEHEQKVNDTKEEVVEEP